MKIKLPEFEINASVSFLFLSLLVLPFIYSTAVPDPSLAPRLLALNLLVLVFCLILFTHFASDWGILLPVMNQGI